MKRGALAIGLLAATLATGCHTVLWTPEYGADGLRNTEAEERARFYNERYYGDYSYYYELPWWAGLTPTVYVAPERNDDARGDDGFGRDSQARESGGRYGETWRSPATISNGSSGSQEAGSSNDDARTTSNNTNSRSSGGSSDKNVRKTDGGRSNDGGRR
ncbi:MAG: hypothetical protein GF419_01340 [Ignavibacteriales bacterium]|nr:hypothetical protein [Ignavibacteriales bacterium]